MFEDGHIGEDLMAKRLRMVGGVELHTHDSAGNQFGFEDGHFKGHMDGAIRGILEAPKTWHVWEHKQVGDSNFKKLARIIDTNGEKAALKKWNGTYYAQAVLYMHYSGMTRHYMTVTSAGGRDMQSLRTEKNEVYAKDLVELAHKLATTDTMPDKISESPSWWQCRYCEFYELCHGEKYVPEVNCRTCVHATALQDGTWHCDLFDKIIPERIQKSGCTSHTFRPDMMTGRVAVSANDDGTRIEYDDGLVNYKNSKDIYDQNA